MTMFGKVKESTLTPEEADALRKETADILAGIVGETWVTIDPMQLDTYSWQYAAEAITGSTWMPRPLAVALPGTAEEISAIVRHCNEAGIMFKAISTGFGAWAGPGEPDSVVLLDLRRMNRIVEIDVDNMYAVVEPYVTGNQLQTEAFKVGLNTHIAGSGGQTSVLASATSVEGQGMDGVAMGYSGRNLLGVEWVTPEGEILHLGSFGSSGTWFSGDGPGPSIRGVIRGFAGAFGGLGVFTRAAVKLYPWEGPARIQQSGSSPDYRIRIPKHHVAAVCIVNDWESMADLAYRVGEAEIATYLARNAPAMQTAALTSDNNEYAEIAAVPVLAQMHFALSIVITAETADERDLKVDILKAILSDLGGGMMSNLAGLDGAIWSARAVRVLVRRVGLAGVVRSLPGLARIARGNARRFGWRRLAGLAPDFLYLGTVRAGLNMRNIFRFGGSFWTSLGSLVTIDNAIRGAKVGAQVKRKYIDRGVIFDDGADNAWGGLYEGGAYAHLEELAAYDQTDPECAEGVLDFIYETNLAAIDQHCALPINAIGPAMSDLFSPHCGDYDEWQRRIKTTFDPNGASEGTFYVDPDFEPDDWSRASLDRVRAGRTEVDPELPG